MLLFFILSFNFFSVFLWFKNSAWDFLGFNFGSGFFEGVLHQVRGIFWVLIYDPIRTFLLLLTQSTPLGILALLYFTLNIVPVSGKI